MIDSLGTTLPKKVFLPILHKCDACRDKGGVLAAVWDSVSPCLIDPAERRAFFFFLFSFFVFLLSSFRPSTQNTLTRTKRNKSEAI